MTQPHGPLYGLKVVACSTAQAGTVPYVLMADLGAEVIKIEVPGGCSRRGAATSGSRACARPISSRPRSTPCWKPRRTLMCWPMAILRRSTIPHMVVHNP